MIRHEVVMSYSRLMIRLRFVAYSLHKCLRAMFLDFTTNTVNIYTTADWHKLFAKYNKCIDTVKNLRLILKEI